MPRPAGSPNKRTKEVLDLMAAQKYDPIVSMIKIARDDEVPLEIRATMHKELAQYAYPKRKAIEHSGEGGGPMQVQIVDFTKSWDAEGGDGR